LAGGVRESKLHRAGDDAGASDELTVDDLPEEIRDPGVAYGLRQPSQDPDDISSARAAILRASEATGGNKARAAELLGVDRAPCIGAPRALRHARFN
jgi:transcriptional regulator of acetoin/glycerol metabolism